MVKINDLQSSRYFNSFIDMVAIIAKIGEVKFTDGGPQHQYSKSARNILLFDDSGSMVKLIVRNNVAINYENFQIGSVIQMKHIHLVKLKSDVIVLTTVSDSEINLDANTPEALRLKTWHITTVGGMDSEQLMINLSLPSHSNYAGNTQLKRLFPINLQNERPSKQLCVEIHKASKLEVTTTDTLDEPKSTQQIAMPVTLISNASQYTDTVSSVEIPLSQNDQQKSEQTTLKVDNIIVLSDDEDEITVKEETDFKIKIERKENEQNEEIEENEESDESDKKNELNNQLNAEKEEEDDNVIKETFGILMSPELLEGVWTEDMDKHLVNHISKYYKNLQEDTTFKHLLREKPQVFKGITETILKLRVIELANAKLFTYFLKLCGGDNLRTEEEKCLFIIEIEKRRKAMQLLKNNMLIE